MTGSQLVAYRMRPVLTESYTRISIHNKVLYSLIVREMGKITTCTQSDDGPSLL